ncbi:ZIP family metal transporter [Haloflavibacter putidus]|uniref:Divalent cation transporter n=1 Tax=Haloflavibacter putidus TaxID=2576776 RepID=A0A508A4C5_9FLAO|nr:ZIP family metal transporter [Haloflavibacter putidus]TQD40722.1 divalent cation transporter [Haloflavibacter putidus]
MSELGEILLYAGFSGITVIIGGFLAHYFTKKSKQSKHRTIFNHSITAFGGGIILSALAMVLVPKGMEELSLAPVIIWFVLGSLTFFLIDRFLEKKGGQIAQLLAMLMDFIPESIALGAIFATDTKTGILLAIFIGLQNLPEAFNSYQDLRKSNFSNQKTLWLMFALSFSGIVGSLIGYFFLQDQPEVTSSLMLFASGGILYLIFEDIAPQAKLEQSWLPALGANLGFLIGIVGEKLIG